MQGALIVLKIKGNKLTYLELKSTYLKLNSTYPQFILTYNVGEIKFYLS